MKLEEHKEVEWLVTVYGYNIQQISPDITVSVKIKLEEGKTPVDWFLSKPKLYSRFTFTPCALLNFWKLPDGN